MARLETCNKVDHLVRRNRAHDSKLEGYSFQLTKILRQPFCLDGSLVDSFEVGSNHLTEVGEMCEMAFTVKEGTAEFSLELLNGPGEGRLRNVALFSRAREVQFLRDRKKITDLMHFHAGTPQAPLLLQYYQRKWLTVISRSPDVIYNRVRRM